MTKFVKHFPEENKFVEVEPAVGGKANLLFFEEKKDGRVFHFGEYNYTTGSELITLKVPKNKVDDLATITQLLEAQLKQADYVIVPSRTEFDAVHNMYFFRVTYLHEFGARC